MLRRRRRSVVSATACSGVAWLVARPRDAVTGRRRRDGVAVLEPTAEHDVSDRADERDRHDATSGSRRRSSRSALREFRKLGHGFTLTVAGAVGELGAPVVEARRRGGAGRRGRLADPVSPWLAGSTYAVAVIVPVSSRGLGLARFGAAGRIGASLTLWIVSRRPLTCIVPAAVRCREAVELVEQVFELEEAAVEDEREGHRCEAGGRRAARRTRSMTS